MRLNVTFDYAKVYDFKSLDVVSEQKFKVDAIDFPSGIMWFSNNDKVLEIEADGDSAIITAKNEGVSTILFLLDNQVLMSLDITVTSLVNLNPTAVDTVLK